MNRKFLYIINPISGTRSKASLHDLVREKTAAEGFACDIFPSVATGDYSFLYPIIREQGYTDIVIAGGDGTINQAVNSLRGLDVQFGIIPCGSGNGLAFSAGIPKNHGKALEIVFRGRSRWTDGFIINDTFACMLVGLGFDAQVAHDFANDPRRGLSTYIKHTIKDFLSAKTHPFVIRTHDKELHLDAFFISIANSNQFGNHFTIAPKASLTDGMLDIVIMAKQNKLSMLFQALKQVVGFNHLQEMEVLDEKANVLYFQTDEIRIHNPSCAPMHIDGDPVESADNIRVEVQAGCFKLIYP